MWAATTTPATWTTYGSTPTDGPSGPIRTLGAVTDLELGVEADVAEEPTPELIATHYLTSIDGATTKGYLFGGPNTVYAATLTGVQNALVG